jgi:nitroreductase
MHDSRSDSSSALLRERYRQNAPPDDGPWNDTLATMLGHRSVRAFLPKPVTDSVLARLISAAQSASSSSNLQAWSVIAVRDPARKARLAKLAGNQKYIEDTPLFLAWLADLSRPKRVAAAKGCSLQGADYVEAFLVGVVDAALAAQNAATAAESLGLGIVYIGGMRNHPEEVAEVLGLPLHVVTVFGMCIGYPDPSRPADVKPRLPLPLVLHSERYDRSGETERLETFEQAQSEFRAEQNMSPISWTDQIIDRWADAKALRGRDRLRAALLALGFELR